MSTRTDQQPLIHLLTTHLSTLLRRERLYALVEDEAATLKLRHAIYARYTDLCALGVEEQATDLLRWYLGDRAA